MSIVKFAGAAAIACTVSLPARAQQVIYEPGYCAQFYPNANCQNEGAGNPYTGSYQRQAGRYEPPVIGAPALVPAKRPRHRTHPQ